MHEGRARHDAPFQIQYLNLFLIACCKRMCEGSLLLVYAKKSVVIPGVARRQGARPRLAEGGACAPLREAWKNVAARVSVTSYIRGAPRDAHAASP